MELTEFSAYTDGSTGTDVYHVHVGFESDGVPGSITVSRPCRASRFGSTADPRSLEELIGMVIAEIACTTIGTNVSARGLFGPATVEN